MEIVFNEKPVNQKSRIKSSSYFTKNILLVGNGIDLELNRKTSFIDFVTYILFFLSFYSYNDFLQTNHVKLSALSCDDELKSLISTIIVNKKQQFSSLQTLYSNIINHSWLKNKLIEKRINYRGKLLLFNSEQVKYWSDFESVIRYILGYDNDRFSPYASLHLDKISEYADLQMYESWLNDFESGFCQYINDLDYFDNYSVNLNGKLKNIKNDYIGSFISRSRGLISDFNLEKDNGNDFIINYNYTSSINALFNYIKKENICCVNGNYCDNYLENNNYFDNPIVIGCSLPNNCSSNHLIFDKKTRRILKNTLPFNLDKFILPNNENSNFNLIIFGHSCNLADQDVISFLLKHEKLKSALIFCYSYDALISIYNNLVSMLGRDILNKMLDYSDLQQGVISKKIFFGVRK